MLHPGTRRHPLHIPMTITACSTHGIGMVHHTVQDNGNGFEAPVWVDRKTGDLLSMVHAPSIFGFEVIAKPSSLE